MSGSSAHAFFAYPSNPPSISEIIHAAVHEINTTAPVILKTWEECRVGGKIIIQELCKDIDDSDLFCADITGMNANVMFELGYAIAKNKRIWLILDTSLSESRKHFDQMRTLTTVGYAQYCNSTDIKSRFLGEAP